MKLERIENEEGEIAFHMARDEALLESAVTQKRDIAVIRFYSTFRPALTVGRNQKLSHSFIEECGIKNIDLARRLTGGRGVPHFEEITYSITAPMKGIFSKGVVESYMSVSEKLAKGLRKAGFPAEISRVEKGETRTVSCFDSMGRHEITLFGEKILGSAQYRKSGYLIQQGTLVYGRLKEELGFVLDFKGFSIEDLFPELPQWNQTADRMFECVAELFDYDGSIRSFDERERRLSESFLLKYSRID
ncbi:hypothetical protein JW890_01175 [candidate division WOR-3 bacterium]|nr:hypothetical protein [candidate division WOR-3 bacterium]